MVGLCMNLADVPPVSVEPFTSLAEFSGMEIMNGTPGRFGSIDTLYPPLPSADMLPKVAPSKITSAGSRPVTSTWLPTW